MFAGRALAPHSPDGIKKMRMAGRVVAEMHASIRAALRDGVTTGELDRVGRAVLDKRGATSNFLGYGGFPAVICASPNDVVVHGIPGSRRLLDGDLISVDCGAVVEGWHGDAAFTTVVGTPDAEVSHLIETTEAALAAGIDRARPGGRLSDIGHAVQAVATDAGLDVVRDYCGHGIGTEMHTAPDVPNFGRAGRGPQLVEGVTLAIEPMVTTGSIETTVLDDDWTVVTVDGSLAAHCEHTVLIGPDGPEILTILA